MSDPVSAALERRVATFLAVIAVLAILFATVWPFNPSPPNQVEWLQSADGVHLGTHGFLRSEFPLQWKTDTANSCTIAFAVQPALKDPGDAILSIYQPQAHSELLLRQWADSLLVLHSTRNPSGTTKTDKFELDHAFTPGKPHLIVIASGPTGTIAYLDSHKVALSKRPLISPDSLAGEISVGNAALDYEPWSGDFRGLAIYSQELSPVLLARQKIFIEAQKFPAPDSDTLVARYDFSERSGTVVHNSVRGGPNLLIPPTFSIPHKPILASPLEEFEITSDYVNDVARNIAGFVPLGFAFCIFLLYTRFQSKAFLLAALGGGLLSLFVEYTQAFIPQRVSGWTDVITNTLGAALGALLLKSAVINRVARRAIAIAAGWLAKRRGNRYASSPALK